MKLRSPLGRVDLLQEDMVVDSSEKVVAVVFIHIAHANGGQSAAGDGFAAVAHLDLDGTVAALLGNVMGKGFHRQAQQQRKGQEHRDHTLHHTSFLLFFFGLGISSAIRSSSSIGAATRGATMMGSIWIASAVTWITRCRFFCPGPASGGY